ncbi:MAG: DUF4956 domain-containing protein [Anaerolineaceae bacterium]|nr:DUF4956 domain-containing protein [Anaerolineaceae bacterium]
MDELAAFLLGFGLNFLTALILVRFIYYPSTHDKRYVFTFLAFNTIIFLVVSMLSKLEVGIGVGFGLFAVFSILRYRTDPIPVREMTYLFVIAALPVMNSAALSGGIWPQIIIANIAVLILLMVLERGWGFRYEGYKRITYEKIELIHPDHRAELISDLENRTGIKIKRINIGKINFLRDTVDLKIYYEDARQENWISAADADIVSMVKFDDD